MVNVMDAIKLPCTEREFIRWINEKRVPNFTYLCLFPASRRVYTQETMRLLFNYLEERFGDKPEMSELIERL